MTMTVFLTEWLQYEQYQLRKSTYEAYTIYVNRHLIPYFENLGKEIEAIKPMDIQRYVQEKLSGGRKDSKDGGLSLVTVRKHISVLKQALNQAEVYGYIDKNPAAAIRLPRQKEAITKRTVMLTTDEAQKVIDAFDGNAIVQLAVKITLLYGLRRSEVLGLQWKNIDMENNTIAIRHTVVKNLTIQEADETKTESSNAVFQLLPEIREALQQHKAATKKYNSEYVFCRENGSCMRPDTLTRTFQKGLKKAGLPNMRFHDLRHSTACILFDRGWGLEDVKNWMRHTDIETTSNIYMHYSKKRRVLIGKDLEGIYKK